MTALTLWNPGNQFLAGGLSVLLQVTLLTSVILLLAVFVRRNAAIRSGLLSTALVLILLCPAITFVMQSAGTSLLTVSLLDDSPAFETRPVASLTTAEAPVPASKISSAAGEEITRLPQTVQSETVPAHNLQETDTTNETGRVGSQAESRRISEHAADNSVAAQSKPTWRGRPLRTVLSALLLTWLAGAVLLLLRLVIGWCRLALILRGAQPNTSSMLAESFAQAGQVFSLDRLPELVLSERLSVPVSAGLFRPRVVFPARVADQLAPDQLREICIHELAHSVRRDQVFLVIQNLVAALFWIHPLVKILNRQLTQAREEICDNYVLLATTDATSYSRTLLTLARSLPTEKLLPGAIGLFGVRWKLEQRIAGLLDQNRNRQTRLSKKNGLVLAALSLIMAVGIAGGTVAVAIAQTRSEPATDQSSAKQAPIAKNKSMTVQGTITDPDGVPARGALVSLLGLKDSFGSQPERELVQEGVTDKAGEFKLSLPETAVKKYTSLTLIARTEHSGIGWQKVDLEKNPAIADLKLPPEQLMRVQFVDPEGRPANQLSLDLKSIIRTGKHKHYLDETPSLASLGSDSNVLPASLKTDKRGLLTLKHIAPGNGVFLDVAGTDRFAPQSLFLNSGLPEKRGEHDGTYRAQVRNNIQPDKVATVVLSPAQIFAGTVLLGESGKPAAHARITIWASQQERFGSMVSVESQTDAAGHFHLNPRPGVRFGIIAYPPQGTPYQTKELKDLRWSPGKASENIEIRLGKVTLAQGTVVDAKTGQPLVGASVQYEPEGANNKNNSDSIITGWQGIQKTDAAGKFAIAVLPGPGTLLVHAASRKYILQETDSETLYRGKPGGMRIYANAFQKIDPVAGQPLQPLKIELQPGETVSGTLVDEQGQPIKEALMISRLMILPTSPSWRGWPDKAHDGKFELQGLRPDVEYPVFFLDQQRKLGAAATISTRNKTPRIVLKPCGSATVRYVDPQGKPLAGKSLGSLYLVATPGVTRYDFQAARRGEQWADEALTANLDRVNYHGTKSLTTDDQGRLAFPALIPGATYRNRNIIDGQPFVTDEFIVQPGKQHAIGDVEVKLDE